MLKNTSLNIFLNHSFLLAISFSVIHCSPITSQLFGSRWRYRVVNETVLWGNFQYTIFPILSPMFWRQN